VLCLSRGLFALLWLMSLSLTVGAGSVRADSLELSLSRLSQGDCALTDAEGPLVLETDGVPTLHPDQLALGQLTAAIGQGIAPTVLAPVTTSGPVGFDVGLETTVTSLDTRADYLARGTRGAGAETCAGRNDAVRSTLVTNRLHFVKGLPYGLSVGALVGRVQAAGSYVVGGDLKLALLEEVWHARLPDVALRAALNQLVGEHSLALFVAAFDAIVSKRFIVGHRVELSPWLGAGLSWTRARTGRIDLTPNIDALACHAGVDPVCTAGGLGASDQDLAHDVQFARVSLLRARAFVGLWLRFRQLALSSSFAMDPVPARVAAGGQGTTVARQWTVSVAPTLTF
jgi:hypothetical protein